MKNLKLRLTAVILALAMLVGACSGIAPQTTPTVEPQTVDEVPSVVNATGKVTPQHYSQLSVSAPGLVQEVLVEEGDEVEAGQPLLRLKGKEDLSAAIAAAEFEVAAAQKALDDLDKAAADARTLALQQIALREKELRDARYQLDNFTPPVEQSKMTATEALEWAKKRLDEAYAAFEPYRYYSENNATRKERKEDYDQAQADYNAAVKRLEYETAVAVAQANLDKARRDYETWKDGPDPKDLAVAQARLENAQAALAAAKAQLEDLELRAPFAGTVSEVNVRLGEWVNPGQPLVVLADLAHLQVETTDLNEIDAARVAVGDTVIITFDALPGVEMKSVVKSISPKAAAGSGVNYTAIILLPELPPLLRWGMTAFVDIQVSE
jgi:multidrug efflux pump subunit AcrA (membrane-fusion protein)